MRIRHQPSSGSLLSFEDDNRYPPPRPGLICLVVRRASDDLGPQSVAFLAFGLTRPHSDGPAADLHLRIRMGRQVQPPRRVIGLPEIRSDHDEIIALRQVGKRSRTRLARAACAGLLDGGVLPVIKHIPGHGRARVDSHHACPLVETAYEELVRSDFVPFRALAGMPWAMTAHIVYAAIDPGLPATLSRRVVAEVIRGEIGFDGVLISDDLSMRALGGNLGERTRQALAAGCDLALHCNGNPAEMAEVAAAAAPISPRTAERLTRGEALRRGLAENDFERREAEAEFDALLAGTQVSEFAER